MTISILVLPSIHERKYLNFIFSSAARFAISVHIVLSREEGKVHVLSQLCYHRATPGGKRRDFRRLTFSNMASYFPYANQLVLIQRWAKSSASCLASSEGSLDKPGDTRRFQSLHKPTNLFFLTLGCS